MFYELSVLFHKHRATNYAIEQTRYGTYLFLSNIEWICCWVNFIFIEIKQCIWNLN